MILTGEYIKESVERKDIIIDPFDSKQLNPTSYDLRLGDQVVRYDYDYCLDVRKENETIDVKWDTDNTMLLLPGFGYLMHTMERFGSEKFVPVLDGKSSLGRLFIWIHVTAGFFDPGFIGHGTLEVVVLHPVRILKGMRFCQVRFHEMIGKVKLYNGHYKDKTSKGAVVSQSFKQIEEDR